MDSLVLSKQCFSKIDRHTGNSPVHPPHSHPFSSQWFKDFDRVSQGSFDQVIGATVRFRRQLEVCR
jgi:hypothetical protein